MAGTTVPTPWRMTATATACTASHCLSRRGCARNTSSWATASWGLLQSFRRRGVVHGPDPGEYVNRVVLVEGPTTVETVLSFNEACSACVPNAVLGCTDASADNYNADADTDDGSCLYNTTFNVDTPTVRRGRTFYEVFVTGPLRGWPANSGFNQLLDEDGDGIYSVTIETRLLATSSTSMASMVCRSGELD